MMSASGAGISMGCRQETTDGRRQTTEDNSRRQINAAVGRLSSIVGLARPGAKRPAAAGAPDALALAGLEAGIGLVDDVDAALAAHQAAGLVPGLHRLERIDDL